MRDVPAAMSGHSTGNLSVEIKKPFAVMRRAFALSKKVYISVLLDGPKGIY